MPGRFAGVSKQEWTAVLEDAARVGLLTGLGAGMYQIHPALPGYLAAGWHAEDPAGYDQEREACEQALCTASAAFSRWLTGQIESGNAALAYAIIGLQRRTLGAMLGHALDHHAWDDAERYCPGAGCVLGHPRPRRGSRRLGRPHPGRHRRPRPGHTSRGDPRRVAVAVHHHPTRPPGSRPPGVEVGIITAVIGGTLAFAIGYTIHRTQVTGRRWIDVISALPVAIPGLVVGVAYLWAWIGVPAGLYGTIWILALAFIARFMPDTVKALSTWRFLQIHRELEEAAWVCGKGLLGTIRTIVLPLARPGVVASMTLLFVLAIRELGSSLFLYTSNTMRMSVLLLDYYEGGNLGKTAAFSLVQTVLLGVLIGGANYLSRGAAQGSVARTG